MSGVKTPQREVIPAGCSAPRSLRQALQLGIEVVRFQYRLKTPLNPVTGDTCCAIRRSWEGVCELLVVEARTSRLSWRRRVALKSALSSMKRLFDAQCNCDERLGADAKEAWKDHMAKPRVSVKKNWLSLLEETVRSHVSGWGSGLEKARTELENGEWEDPWLCPDQQGCFERTRIEGGTLSCPPLDACSVDPSLVRLGVAKTKGKMRVVTMQSAYVKEKLKPLHTALYNHLSSKRWLVRGEVTKEDFRVIMEDKRVGERFISGDYQCATDNIHQDTIESIVKVLSEDPNLSGEERRLLVSSFSNLRWKDGTCRVAPQGPIGRGSMMGNLLSFPILCVLNKAIFDISSDIAYGPGEHRKGRFNGDDCMFCGTPEFYRLWRRITSLYGLIVNESKSSFTSRYLELNSRTYDCSKDSFVAKPVLSFLRRKTDSPSCILTDVFNGVGGVFRDDTMWMILSSLRREISFRVPCISNIPARWLKELLRRRWFRDAFRRGQTPVIKKGTKRCVDTVVGPPVRSSFYGMIEEMNRDVSRNVMDSFRGKACQPYSETVDRSSLDSHLSRLPPARVIIRRPLWSMVYARKVFDFVNQRRPDIFLTLKERRKRWIDDSKLLCVSFSVTFSVPFSLRRLYHPPPTVENESGWVLCTSSDRSWYSLLG
nr:MAG: putative RNA-dependent RNA polymerase [Hangzhou botourmia-like virus 2]